jgi:hypothetical protein
VLISVISVSLFVCFCGCAGRGLFVPTQTVTTTTNGQPATNIVYEVNPGVTSALSSAKDIAQDVGGPWGMVVSGGLGLVAAALTWIAKRKSDQKAALLPAIITGVESAPDNAQVKYAIEKVARAAGVESQLNAVVQKITK